MRLAFQKSKGAGLTAFFVNLFSGNGGYSHCELVLVDLDKSLTSTSDEGAVLRHRDYPAAQWVVYELGGEWAEISIANWAQGELGSPYDWLGALRHALPFVQQSKEKWYCSEICVAALQWVGQFKDAKTDATPNALERICRQAGYSRII